MRGFLSIKGAIDKAIDSLTSFVNWAGDAISEATRLPTAEAQAEHFRQVREGKTGGQPTPSSPGDYLDPRTHRWRASTRGLPGGGPAEMNVGGMTIPTPVMPSAADQDLSAGGKPSAAAWPSTTRGGGGKAVAPPRAKPTRWKLGASELQQKLKAEHNFFADSTAQELCPWQQKGQFDQRRIERARPGREHDLRPPKTASCRGRARSGTIHRRADARLRRGIRAPGSSDRERGAAR